MAELIGLGRLACVGTRVSDLGPLVALSSLQSLNCLGTAVGCLGPLANLSKLQRLDASRCRLILNPDKLWRSKSLEILLLFETHIPGIPPEVLSQTGSDNA